MNLAAHIDHTLLKADATWEQVHEIVAQARHYGFASVCVNGVWTARVAQALAGSPVKTCVVVGFPLGANKATIKAIEATAAVKDGAQEIDFVANLALLQACDLAALKNEFMEIVRAARAVSPAVVVKVILETAFLMKDVTPDVAEGRIETACRAARESGCDFVKTSTGFHPAGGASEEAVRLLKKHSGGLAVKASGGIRSYQDAIKMMNAGADRLGCSSGVEIVKGGAAAGGGY